MADDPQPAADAEPAEVAGGEESKSGGTEAEPDEPKEQVESAVDDAVSAAEGTRAAAKWIASSLGAIPGLALVASIVRAPGDAGFDACELALGISFVAAGALIGILAFANVLSPAAVEEKDLNELNLARLPGNPFTDYDVLAGEIARMKALSGQKGIEKVAAKWHVGSAEAELAGAEAAAARLKAELEDAKDADRRRLEEELRKTRVSEAELRSALTAAKGELAGLTVEAQSIADQLGSRLGIRAGLYRLAGADKVRSRYVFAIVLSVLAVALVAAGVTLLGLAPKETEDPAATLVVLKPNQRGMKVLECDAEAVRALKIGGEEKKPLVITLPSPQCPVAAQLVFGEAEPNLGKVEAP